MGVDASVAFKGVKGSIDSSGHGVATPRCDPFRLIWRSISFFQSPESKGGGFFCGAWPFLGNERVKELKGGQDCRSICPY